MRHNHLVLMSIAFVLGLAFAGCKKNTPETLTPKITEDKVEATAISATFTWKVEWIGNRISVVELSERMDMSDSHFFGSEEELNKEVFTVLVEDLKPGTKYYYRYWVWNQNYVSNKFVMETNSFTTKTDMAMVKALEVTDITRTSATGQGEILSDGGLEITERGICWGTSHNPTTSGSHAASSQSTTTFSVLMTELTPEETYYVRAYAKNAKGTAYSEEEVWFVTGDAVPPTMTTAQVTDISWRTAIGGGEVTDDGDAMVTERGLCWSTNNDPTIDDNHVSDGTGTGTFTAEMTGLTAGTTYHVRAYAKNRAGYGYGNDVSFNTADAILPTVTTADPTNITRTTATCGGEVTSDGGADISERGVCWSTNSTPTISDSHLADVENGMGGFSVQITGLTPNTSYYVCSYAINSAGISYGTPKSFATPPIGKPIVVTTQITNITSTTATSGGNVTDDGGTEVTERGICWSTEHNPTLENCLGNAHSGMGTGIFSLNLTELTQGSLYFVRAYATNSIGTSYGNELSLITLHRYTIVVSASTSNSGSVTGDGIYEEGQSCTVTATANDGFAFSKWMENGTIVSSDASYTFTVSGNRTLVANFKGYYNGHEYVDLGLPSGTLWAACNVGASSPEDYGSYFAWAETQPKSVYDWSTYQYCCNNNYNSLTKYCSSSSYGCNGYTDNLTILEAGDDAATANWGNGWCMPTDAQWEELINNTTHTWTTQNGVKGRLFTASNGNILFLPAAGTLSNDSPANAGSIGYYWSNTLDTSMVYSKSVNMARFFCFTHSACSVGGWSRCGGTSVRAVRSARQD